MSEYKKFSLILFLICGISALSLSLINTIARPRILAQLEKEEKSALEELMPQGIRFEPVRKDNQVFYHKSYDHKDELLGYLFKAEKKGYAGPISTLTAITPEGKILGIKVLSHNETPSLGSRINETKTTQTIWDRLKKKQTLPGLPWFAGQFKGKDVIRIDKEIDTISGATISSEAVIKSIKEKAQAVLKEINE